MVLLNAKATKEEREYWIKEIKIPTLDIVPVNNNQDKKFDLLMDYHYSSIFNNSEDTPNNDYLFSGESIYSSEELEILNHEIGRHNSVLHSFSKIKKFCDVEDQSIFVKSLRIFKDKLINELEDFAASI